MANKAKVLELADTLQRAADDPMWANHCELHKRTARESAEALRYLLNDNRNLRARLRALEKGQTP